MPSHWLAVGAETDPLRRARQLQRSWERLLADGTLGPELPPGATAGLRPTIVESWRRSLATGLDPTDLLAPIEADESEVLERWFEHPLGSLTHVLTEQLQVVAEESRSIVVVTDASGLVLHRVGDERLKERATEQMNLVEGARYSEAADGTNGIGTALAADHAFQVFAFEHFNELHHQWICSGAPVHDPVSGQTIGLIDLSSLWTTAHQQSLELVTATARTIEQCLVDARRDRDARLRRRYSDFMTRSTDLLVDRDGYVLDGAEPAHPSRFDIPEGGGDVVLGDGSVAVAAPLGRGEAYVLRRGSTRRVKSAPPVKGLERAEERARELATELAALRQVATLVAREPSADQLFAVVAEQVARIFDVPHVRLVRYEPDGSVVVGGFSEGEDKPFPIGSRWPLDSPGVTATVRQTGRPARIEDYALVTGEVAAVVRGAGMRSAVATPIVVERRLWGAMVVLTPRHEPFPEDTEAQLTDFTELVATAIANAESRVAIARLVDEQAALRRVATLVARGTEPVTVFREVCNEAQALLGADRAGILRFDHDRTVTVMASSGDPGEHRVGARISFDPGFVVDWVHETHQAARFDTDDPAAADMPEIVRMIGVRSAVGSPIVVDGELWGVITLASVDRSLPLGMERRLADFTELVATAISNAQAHGDLQQLADEKAALSRVATLVAQGAQPAEIFEAVAEEVGRLLPAASATMGRFEPDDSVTTLVSWSATEALVFPTGRRWRTKGTNIARIVLQTGRTARLDDFSAATDPIGVIARETGIKSAVGGPIVVNGHIWGLITVTSTEGPMPPGTEARLVSFTDLVATAIANAESGEALAELAEEQAALRRVATLVAQDVPSRELFGAVVGEVGVLLGADLGGMIRYEEAGTVTAVAMWAAVGEHPPMPERWQIEPGDPAWMILENRAATRVEDWASVPGPFAEAVRNDFGVSSSVGCPIVVEGRLWGALAIHSKQSRPLPPNTESRIAQFTDLVGTAIANAESRERADRLGEEQAALRRVATLVAKEASPAEVFAKVAEEAANVLGEVECALLRDEGDRTASTVAAWGAGMLARFPVGTPVPADGDGVLAFVLRERRPRRIDDYSAVGEPTAEGARDHGIGSAVGYPIVVGGGIWGAIVAARFGAEPCPPETESHIARFADLVATAIANAESRAEVERLAAEQAALRRVATLVAQDAAADELFDAVAHEAAELLACDRAAIVRFAGDGTATVVGGHNALRTPGIPFTPDPDYVIAAVQTTGRAARFDTDDPLAASMPEPVRAEGICSGLASPIVVDGALWGTITVASLGRPLPSQTEHRLAEFTELVGTAISNAQSRAARQVLADEQAALRRVATLVAKGASPSVVLDAVAAEMERALGSDAVMLSRYEPEEEVTVVARRVPDPRALPVGTRVSHQGENVTSVVRRTGRPARIGDYERARGPIADLARAVDRNVGSAVGTPIVVDGRLWGVMVASWGDERSPPDVTEERMAKFAQLLDTAIANADSRDQLISSRARVLTAGDEARRRVVRDLHDGAQQRLVHTVIALKLARQAVRDEDRKAESLLSEALEHAQQGNRELRELAHGILPAALAQGGLRAGVDAVVARLDLPVEVDVPAERLPGEIEASAYFIVAEALTNVVKHAHAGRAEVTASLQDGTLRIEVRDDGAGGADPDGHGLVGMADRVSALGGRLSVQSPAGGGTVVTATLPLPAA